MTNLVKAEGYWSDEPQHIFQVVVSLGVWNGIEDEADRNIFFYTDGAPLNVGDIIAEDFVVTEVGESK